MMFHEYGKMMSSSSNENSYFLSISSLVQTRYTAEAHTQRDKDYQRTRDDFYRMELDNLEGYHESNRENMLRTYHSYLENTPGSKKALRELCARVPLNASKPSINTNA